jgi:hypothetical protein
MSKPEKENLTNSKFSVEYIASSAWITNEDYPVSCAFADFYPHP